MSKITENKDGTIEVEIGEHDFEMPDEKEGSEWISVKDRLPKMNERVIVFCESFVDIDYVSKAGNKYYFTNHFSQVSHWMPLPDKPKINVK